MTEEVTVRLGNRSVRFAIADRQEHIQSYLARGAFYEMAELAHHASVIPQRAVIMDIGANVGNHTVFYSKFTLASLIIPVEPMPQCCALLHRTLELNDCKNVDPKYIGYGCGAADETMYVDDVNPVNWGATRLRNDDKHQTRQQITVLPGDAIAGTREVNFVKIDVEGMELPVLAGLAGTISRSKPTMSVEVRAENEMGFKRWRNENNYRIERTFQSYRGVKTYVMFPD